MKKYGLKAPQGVRGRNADLTIVRSKIIGNQKVSFEEGLTKTYRWIEKKANEGVKATAKSN